MKTYDLNQLQMKAERIRECLEELDNIKYNVDQALEEQASLLTQYLEDTEEEIPPWDPLTPYDPRQLEFNFTVKEEVSNGR